MNCKLMLAIASLTAAGTVLADPLSNAVDKYQDLSSTMKGMAYDLTTVLTTSDEVTELKITQEANELPKLVAENGGTPSSDAADEFDPERLYSAGGDGYTFALPDEGYELVNETDGRLTYAFQPLLMNNGKSDRASRYFTGELVVDTACECVASVAMSNTESFRRTGFKIEELKESWQFDTDDWKPISNNIVFSGGALFIQVGVDSSSSWEYR